jgi:hypothetical protein
MEVQREYESETEASKGGSLRNAVFPLGQALLHLIAQASREVHSTLYPWGLMSA